MPKKTKIILLLTILILICTKLVFAQDNLQRHYLRPPYKGMISGYSDWTIPENAWNELTNCYVDEQGKIIMRPGFYCWLNPVTHTSGNPIDGAGLYKKWVETGFNDYIVYQTINKIYYTTINTGNSNTRISPAMSTGYTDESYFNNDGCPTWVNYYNNFFMTNGYDTAIQWNSNNALIAEMGRSFAICSVEFQDSNVIEIVKKAGNTVNVEGSDYTDGSGHYWLHFRIGMDITISDSNNNGTYEIIDVDANLITVSTTSGGAVGWTYEQSDTNVNLYAYSFPDELSSSRTATVTYTNTGDIYFYANGKICGYPVNWLREGFSEGMTLAISGSSNNDGSYTITTIPDGGFWCMDTDGTLTAETDSSSIVFTGSKSLSNGQDCFNPITITGHKGRLFAGGVSEYPTKLYWSQSVFRDQYYWDLWRDSYGIDEGTGNYDIRDKIIALVGEWRNMLVIFCENSIHYLRGDDPGFDILTPSQSLVFHPVPVSRNIGCVGPEAWCEANGDIYFWSKDGLRKLSIVEAGGEAKFTILSLPINDLNDDIMGQGLEYKMDMEFLKSLNLVLINAATTYYNNIIIAYNISNNSFSKWIFTSDCEPACLFVEFGPDIDPNSDYPDEEANPKETIWFGGRDNQFYALTKNYAYDRDWGNSSSPVENSISVTAITSKLNMGQPFLEKQFERTVFLCSPQINYDDASQGQVSFYRKIDDGSWSSAVTKSFDQHSEADGTAIDYYQYLDAGVGFRGQGKTVQYKIEVSGTTGRFGLEFLGAMTEWIPVDTRI